tara:strand:+ start:3359 stop:4999 length:1641 start_codon:yes stop_codon:yes gene_type:complete
MLSLSIKNNESYNGNINVKRDGVVQNFTQDEITEYVKCLKDPAYFAINYCKVISLDRGLVPFDLYPYQEKMFGHFNDSRFCIVLACRQSGKSISSVAYLLWYALFHPEKTIAVLANKGATAREMLARVTLMLEHLPFFLQPGTKALNKGSLEFSNNSRIIAAATSGSSIRGMSVNLLYLDEFAFVERAAEFYTSTYPVISSGKDTKVIITSTANGIGNMFYNIYEGAVQGTNQFKPFRVDWWDVPGRDEAWKNATVSNTSQLQFDQEFGNTFFGTGDTLIGAEALMEQKAENAMRLIENNQVNIYKEPERNHQYVMTVDVAKGRGQDYSTFNVIDISTRPFEQVAVYRCNTISPILFPNIIYKYAKVYNEAYVIVESNDQGGLVTHGLYYELEYEHIHMESLIRADRLGVEMNKKVKRIGCSAIKDLIESRKIKIRDANTIMEMSTFIARGQSFEASDGNHDDLMMNLVLFGYFAVSNSFEQITEVSLKEMMFKQRMDEIDDDVLPFGFIDDGLDNITAPMDLQNENENWIVADQDNNSNFKFRVL